MATAASATPTESADVQTTKSQIERGDRLANPVESIESPADEWLAQGIAEPETIEAVTSGRGQPLGATAIPENAIAQNEDIVGPEADDSPDTLQFDITPAPDVDVDVNTPQTPTPSPIPEAEPGDVQAEPSDEPEPRVLVAEVLVVGAGPELEEEVYRAISTRAGRTATRSQLQEDINAIFATGWFSNVRAVPSDTPLGVRVTFEVEPNPVLRSVEVSNSQVLPTGFVDEIFDEQYGSILNLRALDDGIRQLNNWYESEGYILAQVIDTPDISPDGVVTLEVAEGIIEDIEISFLDENGSPVDEDGEPIEGRTRDFIVTRELSAQPGDVFNQEQIQRDLQRVFGLGLFDDVRVALNPGDDPRKVDVVLNLIEGNSGSLAAGLGFSGSTGLFGTVSYQQRNLGGNNQRLNSEIQIGERGFLFDVGFTDPWIAGDPYRTSYTVNVFNRRSLSLVFDGGDPEVNLPDEDEPNDLDAGDRPRVDRLGGGISFTRPLDEWLGWDNWRGSVGLEFQRVSIRDADGDLSPVDALGNDLSFDGDGTDNIFLVQLGLVNDRRNNAAQPTSGSVLRIGTEQSIPMGNGNIFFNRLRGSYSRYFPVDFTDFSDEETETLAFNVQLGTVVGDLPPYEAFTLGGTDSVRGYGSGELGTGRSFLQATAEYRFPLFAIVGGAVFLDYGTDLGTADDVPGEPANVRDKPGSGFGYGLGLRIQSPIGPIRIDYGFGEDGDGRFHFGFGERF
jgi:outer membrane protein insertion porin family